MMKYRKRAAGIILCAAMAGNLLTGCSTSQKTETAAESVGSEAAQTQQASEKAPEKPSGSIPNIRLVSWQTPSDPKTKPVYDAVAEFAEAHKSEFTLEHENILGDELKAKIKTDVASNTVPDVFLYWGSGGNSAMLLDADVIIPFDEYLDASAQIKRDLFPQESFARTSAGGTLATITGGLEYGVWFCNQELFDQYQLKLPETLDDMIEAGKVFNENGIVPFAMGSKGGNPAHEFVAEIFFAVWHLA